MKKDGVEIRLVCKVVCCVSTDILENTGIDASLVPLASCVRQGLLVDVHTDNVPGDVLCQEIALESAGATANAHATQEGVGAQETLEVVDGPHVLSASDASIDSSAHEGMAQPERVTQGGAEV